MARTRTITEPSADQILNICRSNNEPAEKERMLLSIGLQRFEAHGLAYINANSQPTATERAPQHTAATQYSEPVIIAMNALAAYTVGVEIECFATRSSIISACVDNNVNCESEGYNHTDNTTHFKLVTDASVQGLANPVECVSPILQYNEAADKLQRVCSALSAANAQVNKSCGLHVHVSAVNLTEQEYCNVFVNYMYMAQLIEKSLAPSRRQSRWAKDLRTYESRVLAATSINGMQVALNADRYFQVNPMSYMRHKTIEFRQHQGTVDFNKINNWLNFCVKLVEWSKNNRLTAETAPQTFDEVGFLNENEKNYFKMRAAYFSERAAA